MTTLVDALDNSYARTAALIAGIDAAQLARPTPCADWDVRATLDHVIGASWMFTLANEGEAVGEDSRDIGPDGPEAALRAAHAANLASWRTPGAFDGERAFPFGTFPADAAALMNLSEIVVHTWDIAVALDGDTSIDPAIAKMLDEFYAAIPLDPYRAHGAFGPEVIVDAGASHADRLLGRLGRRPAVS
jgi:uncharacterized protein (TIGR03086 family)